GGYDGFAQGHCLEHLNAHSSALAKRCQHYRGTLDESLDPGHSAGDSDAWAGQGTHRPGRANAYDREVSIRVELPNGGEDFSAKPDCGIDIRRVIEASRENYFAGGLRKWSGGRGDRHPERIDPNAMCEFRRHNLNRFGVALGEYLKSIEAAPHPALVAGPP